MQGRIVLKHLQRSWCIQSCTPQFSNSLQALDAFGILVQTGCQRLFLTSQPNRSGGGIFCWFSKVIQKLAWYVALWKWGQQQIARWQRMPQSWHLTGWTCHPEHLATSRRPDFLAPLLNPAGTTQGTSMPSLVLVPKIAQNSPFLSPSHPTNICRNSYCAWLLWGLLSEGWSYFYRSGISICLQKGSK